MPSDLPQQPDRKAQVRRIVRARVKGLSASDRERASAAVRSRIQTLSVWIDAQTVLLYAPLEDELDVWPLLADAVAAGKTVALPRYVPEDDQYVACRVEDQAAMRAGQFGVREPVADACILPLNQLDLVLVPGVAFDWHGRRLGRGRGFYDRLLSRVSGTKCGVGFDEQIEPDLPHESHDVVLDCILTPSHWREFGLRRS